MSNEGSAGPQIQRTNISGVKQETAHCSCFDSVALERYSGAGLAFPAEIGSLLPPSGWSSKALRVSSDRKRIKIVCNESSRKNSNQAQGVGRRRDSISGPHIGKFEVARCNIPDLKEDVMKTLLDLYTRFSGLISKLQSPFLLAVRLYWGWQFAQSGWGKLHHLDKVTDFFTSLNLPAPGLTAHFVSGLEFVGGILLILGLGSVLIGLLLTLNMLVAYWTADKEAFVSVFSDPGKFYVADPYTFLFSSAMVLVFGAGLVSLDALLVRRWHAGIEK